MRSPTIIRVVITLLILAVSRLATAGTVVLEPIAMGLSRPVAIAHAGDGTGRVFIVEQAGKVRIHDGTGVKPTPFLDIGELVTCCGERGLLSLAFHPDYPRNGLLFVNYTDLRGDTVVARYRVSTDPNVVDSTSGVVLLSIPQPFANHNGGQLQFGKDGYLYMATGDGGSGGDPGNNAQRLDTLLGKILRIDVDSGVPFAIPPGNPFIGQPGARPEIWAYGLRNPWRFSFDRLTGDLFIADVGQNRWEEINFQAAASNGGENYGWRRMEGMHCFDPPNGCNQEGLTLPIIEYSHDEGCSVTGGYRYRGSTLPELAGRYIYADFCSGRVWASRQDVDGSWVVEKLLDTNLSITSFGEDEAGELYVAHGALASGAVYRLRPMFVISPPSGTYASTQSFDLTLILRAPAATVISGHATLDGTDVTSALAGCLRGGTLGSGGTTFRCPGLSGALLGEGTHRLDVTLDLGDGSTVGAAATWEILRNFE